jgi:hypothetical protein
MIPQRNLSLLSNRLARHGGRRIPEAVLERDYCLAWFLVGLSGSPLRNRLAFKGGTALKRCYFGDYRFSEDLNFTLLDDAPFETIRSELDPVFQAVHRAAGLSFHYAREDRHHHVNSYTFYLAYEGPLPSRSASEVKVDLTIRERLVLPLESRPVLRGYPEYEDLPSSATVQVYSLDEIAVEKVVALGDRARNEPRDLYDIWYLTSQHHVDLASLTAAIQSKLDFRGKTLTTLAKEFLEKEARLQKLWTTRLAIQMASLPRFADVYRATHRCLRQAGLTG